MTENQNEIISDLVFQFGVTTHLDWQDWASSTTRNAYADWERGNLNSLSELEAGLLILGLLDASKEMGLDIRLVRL